MRALRLAPLLAALLLLGWSGQASAVLQIEITEGATGTRPIAVVPFTWQGDGERPADIAAIVDDDLARSGQFAPMERRNMVAQPGSGDDIDFGSWRTLEVDHVVVGAIEPSTDGGYRVRFQLFDVARQRQVTGYRYSAEGDALRGLAHTISDAIYEAITGERGAFATRVAFVSTGGPGQARAYRLRVADYDGSNARNVLASDEPVMSPAWSPDGERLALTLSHEGNPELYVLDLGTDELQRVTRNSGIDTSPAWMPSGEQIVFTSDRAGGPQLYKAAADGSGQAERLTFDGAYNADPDVGPNGARVAFVHRTRASQYRIAVLALESGRMRVVTEGRLDESPSFAPNGRMILYATEHQGRGVLGSVSVDGSAAARLSRAEGDVREPAWGPFRD
ncbi:MAG: Tol-Pal system protein TolB [Proteobacteria bacterium SW_6_67_9]|nr:MAG: Tol-Pal system protein TolB [Proteobacteria bacterium SW_6_67_9]